MDTSPELTDLTKAKKSMTGKTVGIVVIVTAACIVGYRWYGAYRTANAVETVNIGEGATITIRALPDYCTEVTGDFITALEQATILNGKAIAVSAPCSDVKAFKAGKVARLQKYIVWFVGSTNSGSPGGLSADTTRSDFASQMVKNMPMVDLGEVASDVEKSGLKVGIIDQGLIGREADAVYMGSIIKQDDDGGVRIIASVTGIAAIHHRVLSINFYDEFRGNPASLSELLPSVQSLMHAALSDNPES